MTPTHNPRLLIVTTTFPRWEDDPIPAPFVFHLARALASNFQVTVLAPHFRRAEREEEMEGVLVRRFRYAAPERLELLSDGAGILNNLRQGTGRKALAPLLIAGEYAALLRETRRGYDFINSHWLLPSGLLTAMAAPAGIPHVITCHAADYDLLARLPGGGAAIRYMAGRARAVVCAGSRLAEGVCAAAPEARVITRSMGVEMEAFRFDAEAREEWRDRIDAQDLPVILFAGKLTRKKGVDVLLRALPILARRTGPVKLIIAGDGAERPALARQAAELGLSRMVAFLGATPNRELARVYSAADAVAVPSVRDPSGETEGMPVVILEALAAGRPVAASTLCSVPSELLGRGVIEVESGSEDDLADGLARALSGEAAVDLAAVSAFDVKAVAQTYAGIFLGEGG